MSYSILDVKNDISGILHGTTANQITNFYGVLFRAASRVIQDIDPEETRRTQQLVSPIYGQTAFDYACPSDLKGNRFIDLRPQANRKSFDVPTQLRSQDFDIRKVWPTAGSMVEVRNNNHVKTLRIAIPSKGNILLNDCDTPTSNGLWTATGLATTPVTDNLYFVEGAGSLKYSLTGNGALVNSTLNHADLTDYQDQGVLFAWVFLQSASLPTSHTLIWGSDGANYWSKTVAAQWDGTAYQQGWNLLGFDWSSAAKTLTPDVTNIGYLSFTTTTGVASTPVRLDAITCALGSIYEFEYYSKYLFRNLAGTFLEKPTADSDMVNLDTDSYMLFLNAVASEAAQQQQGKDTGFDLPTFEGRYKDSLMKYYRKYPSQAQKATGTYYKVQRSSYANRYGTVTLRP